MAEPIDLTARQLDALRLQDLAGLWLHGPVRVEDDAACWCFARDLEPVEWEAWQVASYPNAERYRLSVITRAAIWPGAQAAEIRRALLFSPAGEAVPQNPLALALFVNARCLYVELPAETLSRWAPAADGGAA